MIINLTTPMSDDKERQRRNEVIIAEIERHTEERMNDEYGRIHTDGSRSGGQPVKSDVNERLGAWLSAALDDPNCSDAFKQDINDWFASQPTQSDALRKELATRFYRKSGEFQVGLTVPEATILAAEAFAFLQEQSK